MASTKLSLSPKAGEIKSHLLKSIGDLAKASPKHFTAERLVQVAMICVFKTPKLQDCVPESMITSVMTSASLGLDLTPSMGEAYLIPRWNKQAGCLEAQFQVGYRGLAKLARQAGGVNYIQSELVREKDKFEAIRDPDWRIRHEPVFGGDGGNITHIYAVAKLATGEYQLAVMTTEEIEAIRLRSQYPDSGPWASDWSEMGKKTVIKRLCKGLPNNADPAAFEALSAAIELDNREYERDPDAHHAKNHLNDSGHGTGAYANPADVKAYEEWAKDQVDAINVKWLDKHTDRKGVIAEGAKDLLSHFQLRGHLYKWAKSVGLINAPDEARSSSDKFTAVAWVRDRDQIEAETLRYGREKWREQLAKMAAAKPSELDPLDELIDSSFEEEPGSDG